MYIENFINVYLRDIDQTNWYQNIISNGLRKPTGRELFIKTCYTYTSFCIVWDDLLMVVLNMEGA